MKKMTMKKMIEIAEKGYGDFDGTFPKSYEEALKHDNGDGLSNFIVIELREAAGGDPALAAHLMRRSAEQLNAVAREFEESLDN